MLNKVASLCRSEGLIAPGDTVTVALSGGADSMALLWCLYLLKEKLDFSLKAAHFHHGLRAESDEEEQFVRAFCEGYGIPLTVGHVHVVSRGKGLEAAAREDRYRSLLQAAGEGKLATAHTLSDNAETLLIRLTRGTSLRGLGGIPLTRGTIIRPLLTTSRAQVEAFLAEWSIPHREDQSNGENTFLRNRVRHDLLPKFVEENPDFLQNTYELTRSLRLEDDLLSRLSAQGLEACRAGEGLSVPGLLAQHPALRRRILAAFLVERGLTEPQNFQIDQAEALLLSRKPGARFRCAGGLTLSRVYDRLEAVGEPSFPKPIPLVGEGDAFFGDHWAVSWKKVMNSVGFQNNPFTFRLRCGIMALEGLCLRPRQTGDRLRLTGGTKSLSRRMVDQKIPKHLRDQIPVLAWEDGVIAVAQLGCDPQWLAPDDPEAIEFSFIQR